MSKLYMDELDLNINNYTMTDLESFFQLKPNVVYNAATIEEKEVQIREILISSQGKMDKRFKKDVLDFLTLARDWLIFVKCRPPKQPTTIPANHRIDNTQYTNLEIPRSDELQPVKPNNIPLTHNVEFVKGSLNPLNNRIITKCLNIDTRFRKDILKTQSSDFVLQLPTNINKVVSMTLSSFELPVTFYGITEAYGNNYLYVKTTYKDFDNSANLLQSEKVVTINDGNYNAVDLLTILNNKLAPKDTSDNLINVNDPFSYIHITHDITTTGSGSGKVTIQPNTDYVRHDHIVDVTLDFNKGMDKINDNKLITTKLGYNLGYLKSNYTGSTRHTADTIIEPSLIRYIYLAVDDFNNSSNNHFISVFADSLLSPNILARISIKGSYFSLLMENDFNIVSEPRRYFGPVDIQRLRIRLLDEHGRVLQMNNANFSFCINLKTIYDL